ncbi:TPA: ATP-dependent zinc metalloprotease FtsH [Candidatus Galligastranaerophilus intestinigallinarum]|nr:ATP-dependent zinc metalloprotease FtsH [Candidatus Galligastranaerophilus intestinigallinarum]
MKNNQSVGVYIIVAIIAAIIACMAFLGPTTSTDEISYSQFLKKVQLGEISSVLISKDTLYAVPKVDNKQTETKENTTSKNEFLNSLAASQKAPEIQYKVTIPSDTDSLYKVLEENSVDINVKKPQEGSVLSTIGSILVPVFFIIMIIFILKGIQQGGSAAMNFGKSRAKMLQESKVKITFNDVAGIDEERQELEEIVDFLKNPEKYTKLGAKIPKGVLLVGAPGTGKTLMAKAVAGEAGVPFFSISGSDFVEMFVGVGASRVRDLFEQAKKHQPCIIFIDEIDAVGRQRGAGLGGGHDEREQTLNQLLVEMDGFDENTNIIVIAATNRPDILDTALLRPGRFDRQIYISLPDIKGREDILKVHSKNKVLNPSVDLKVLAKRTSGFTGADLRNLLNEAALLAARNNEENISMDDIDKSIDRVEAGIEKKSKVLTDEDKETTAYHEVGHALINVLLEDSRNELHKVSIIPRGYALGITWSRPKDERVHTSKNDLLCQIAITLGGRAAEEIVYGKDNVSTGASSDLQKVSETARKMVMSWGMSDKLGNLTYGKSQEHIFMGRDFGHQRDYSEQVAFEIDEEVKSIVDNQYKKVLELLTENRDILDALSHELLEKETMDADEFIESVKKIKERRNFA